MRRSVLALRSVSPGVSKITLPSNTRRRDTVKPAPRRSLRAVRTSATASLISVSVGLPLMLMGAVAVMMIQEILVNGFASAEALIHAVPEADSRLAQLPAEVDFFSPEHGRKVDQSGVEILDHAADFLHLFDGFAQFGRQLIAAALGV